MLNQADDLPEAEAVPEPVSAIIATEITEESNEPERVIVPMVARITASDPACRCLRSIAGKRADDCDWEDAGERLVEIRVFADGTHFLYHASATLHKNGNPMAITPTQYAYVKMLWKHPPCRWCRNWRADERRRAAMAGGELLAEYQRGRA